MGYDATSHLPCGVSPADVVDFLLLCGFVKYGGRSADSPGLAATLHWWKRDHYQYHYGLYASVYGSTDGGVLVCSRGPIYRSRGDGEVHNRVLRDLRKRFGGYFVSDYGRGRYFRPQDLRYMYGAESGCYLAHEQFGRAMQRAEIYIKRRTFDPPFPVSPPGLIDVLGEFNPAFFSNSLLVPYLVAIFEEFCRQSFIVLLEYSSERLKFIKGMNARLDPDDICSVMDGELPIVDATVRWLNFQDLSKISDSFKKICPGLDVAGALRKPLPRRKNTLYETVESLIRRRHGIVHRNEVDIHYSDDALLRDVKDLTRCVAVMYRAFGESRGWQVE